MQCEAPPDLTFKEFYVTKIRHGYQVYIDDHVTNTSTRVLYEEVLPNYTGGSAGLFLEYKGLTPILLSNTDMLMAIPKWILGPGQTADVLITIEKDQLQDQREYRLCVHPSEGQEVTFDGFDVVVSIIQSEPTLKPDPRYEFPPFTPIEAGRYLEFLGVLLSCEHCPSDDPRVVPLRFSSLMVERVRPRPRPFTLWQEGDDHMLLRGTVENASNRPIPTSSSLCLATSHGQACAK